MQQAMLDRKPYLAHLDPEGKRPPQLLLDHLQQVARLAEEFAPTPEMKEAARQCGLYHDAGKYSADFQKYLLGQTHGRVDHSTAGVQLLAKMEPLHL
ncbi:CRISPR-associated endonuclease Cas3'' [Acidaminococcus sp. LBK-2]